MSATVAISTMSRVAPTGLGIVMSPTTEGVVLGAAIVLALVGLYLQLNLVEYQMALEERIKERQLTDEQARRRVLWYRIGGPVAILTSAILFGIVLID